MKVEYGGGRPRVNGLALGKAFRSLIKILTISVASSLLARTRHDPRNNPDGAEAL